MASNPNPFDFTRATGLQDIFNQKTKDIFDRLEKDGLRRDEAFDLFYDALEAPGVDADVRRDFIDIREAQVAAKAEEIGGSTYNTGLELKELVRRIQLGPRDVVRRLLADTQGIAQEAIRINRIKGAQTHPFLREVAREAVKVPDGDRDSFLIMAGLFYNAYLRLKKAPPLPATFSVRNAKSAREIVEGRAAFSKQLRGKGVSAEKAVDLFYDELEAPGIDSRLRQQAVDELEALLVVGLKKALDGFIAGGGMHVARDPNDPRVEKLWLSTLQSAAQEAIRLAKIKGDAADPLVREVAREVSPLPPAQRNSLDILTTALTKAYAQSKAPVQNAAKQPVVRRKPQAKGGKFGPQP